FRVVVDWCVPHPLSLMRKAGCGSANRSAWLRPARYRTWTVGGRRRGRRPVWRSWGGGRGGGGKARRTPGDGRCRRQRGAGGDLGRRFADNPLGVIAWLAVGIAGFALVAPQTAAAAMRESPEVMRRVWSWRIPHRLGHAAKVSFEFVFPTRPQPEVSKKVPIDSAMWAQTAGAATAEEEEDDVEEPVQSVLFPELDADEDDEGDEGVTVDTRGNRRSRDGWQLPSMDVLADTAPADAGRADSAIRASLIEETLASFGVDAKVVQINEGPTVTQFGIEPGWEIKTRTVVERDADNKPVIGKDGQQKTRTDEVSRTRVRVQQITSLANDMALALAAPSIRIEAPVPGKPVLGLEVPNSVSP